MSATKILGTAIATLAIPAAAILAGVATPAHGATTYACPQQFGASGDDFQYSGAVTSETTCGFAESVRFSYDVQPSRGVPTNIVAHSPSTDYEYRMYCTPGTVTNGNDDRVNAVRCSGGINAVVQLW